MFGQPKQYTQAEVMTRVENDPFLAQYRDDIWESISGKHHMNFWYITADTGDIIARMEAKRAQEWAQTRLSELVHKETDEKIDVTGTLWKERLAKIGNAETRATAEKYATAQQYFALARLSNDELDVWAKHKQKSYTYLDTKTGHFVQADRLPTEQETRAAAVAAEAARFAEARDGKAAKTDYSHMPKVKL